MAGRGALTGEAEGDEAGQPEKTRKQRELSGSRYQQLWYGRAREAIGREGGTNRAAQFLIG